MARSDSPLVTVYIPCRNYGRFLERAVESVFNQLYSHWELFIIDEGSDDATADICARYATRDPDRIRIIRNEQPEGLQKVANTVLGQSRGAFIIRLDADDWFDESALLLMATKLSQNPDLGIVYGNYFYTDDNGNILGMERRHELGVEDKAGHLPPHGACTMVRTRDLKSVGGYSEDINAQDGWELWYKLTQHTRAASLNIPVFYYRQHASSLSRNTDRLLKARSRIFEAMAKKLDGGYAPAHLAVLGVRESYPGLEGVPYKELDGVSLLERALTSIGSAKSVTAMMVSSKSQDVLRFAEVLEDQKSVPPHTRRLRESFENGEYLPVQAILLDAGEDYRALRGSYPDVISFHSLHTINCTAAHVDSAFNILRVTKSDSVVSVQEEKSALFSYHENGLKLMNPGRLVGLSYDREKVYRFNGAIITTWWEMLEAEDLLGDNIGYLEMSPHESLQVNSEMLSGSVK